MSFSRLVFTAVIVTLTAADLAHAQGWSITGGAHANPDQVYGGAVYEFATITDRITLRPSGSIGVGDGATLLTANADLTYALQGWRRNAWRPYVGGGPALNHYRLELYSETEPGVNAIAGLRRAPWFAELRVGFVGSPVMSFGVGYSLDKRSPRPTVRPRR